LCIDRERFLAEHGLAAGEAREHVRRVQGVRCGNVDRVDPLVLSQRVVAFDGTPDSMSRCKILRDGASPGRNSDQFMPLVVQRRELRRDRGRHAAGAENSPAHAIGQSGGLGTVRLVGGA
jgi:hypothetical protein